MFEIEKFMGDWLEIARKPNWFEKPNNRAVASYSLNKEGTIKVINRAYNKFGDLINTVVGKATVWKNKDKPTLGIKFFLFEAEYRIEYVNSSYDLAIIGNSKKSYFWILSRNAIAKSDLQEIIKYLEELGYTTSDIIVDKSLVYDDES